MPRETTPSAWRTSRNGFAEVARLRGDVERASTLLAEARERYAVRDDALAVADVEKRLHDLAKEQLSERK